MADDANAALVASTAAALSEASARIAKDLACAAFAIRPDIDTLLLLTSMITGQIVLATTRPSAYDKTIKRIGSDALDMVVTVTGEAAGVTPSSKRGRT